MTERQIIATMLKEFIDSNPAVPLIGPRQVGQATLAIALQRQSIYLDLQSVIEPE